MYAKLILLAEDFEFDDLGRLSASNLLLDAYFPSFPAKLEKVDLLTLWTRGKDEPAQQLFELNLQVGEERHPPEHIPVRFGDAYEAFQGISLDGFEVEKPGAIIFHFTQQGQDRGVWVMRCHPLPQPQASGEA